jgi:hypothetical protein
MNGLYLNKRLEIFVAGLLLKELRPEIEQDLAKTFVLATMSGTKKEIEDAAQRLDRYCFDSVIRDGENSTARVKWGIKEILERDLNQRSLDDTQKASLLKRLPSETKPFSIPILHDLLEKATPAKAAKQPQPTPAQIKSEDLESIIVVNKSEPRQPTLDHRGEAAVESFVDALIAGDDPKTLAFAFFGPKEPPDKTKLRHMMDEVYNQVKGNHTLYGNAVFAWSKHVLAGLGPEKLSLVLERLELIRTESGYFRDFRVVMPQVVNELLLQPKTDLKECVKLLSTDPEKAANLMVAWAEKYQKSGLKADDKEFNISGLVVAALYGTDVVEVIRLRERFTLLLRGGPLSKMNTEISSVVADALKQAEGTKAKASDAETQKNVGAARFIRAVLTGEQGIEQMYSFEEKDLNNILKGRSSDELRDLKDAVENYNGPQLRPPNGLAMLNRILQAYEQSLEKKYLLPQPLVW